MNFDLKSDRECVYCDKKFMYASEKKRHEQSHCLDFECKICLKKFNFLSALKRHEKQHERKGTSLCKECGGNFRDETLLRRHIKYAHKGKFTCSECLGTFSSEPALNTHMKIHKPIEERRYKCSFENCKKSFNFPHHLKHHELTHTNSKQHFCPVCGKGFIQSHHLKRHLKSHEPESWLACVITGCTKRFATEYARKRHYATHKTKTEKEESDKDSRSEGDGIYTHKDLPSCETCGKLNAKNQLHADTLEYMKNKFCCSAPYEPVNHNKQDNNDLFKTKLHENIINQTNNTYVDEPFDNENNCNIALGACIVSKGLGVNENCLCAQIKPATPEHDNKFNVFTHALSETKIVSDEQKLTALTKFSSNVSKECDFSTLKRKNDDICLKLKNDCAIEETMPMFEYRINGVVKLREILDFDTEATKDNNERNNEELTAPWSCKAILGNCIVSGDDTIGEGCLCAKMSQSTSQATAQEIDEITINRVDNGC